MATRRGAIAAALAGGLLALPGRAFAVDTVETSGVGTTDVDFYLGLDNVGAVPESNVVYGDMMIGIGLIPGFSAYLGATLSANGYFTKGEATLYLGLFGTPIDTDHFDLDLFLDFSAGGPGFSALGITPSVELNFDAEPDLASWGVYLRAGETFGGRTHDDGTCVHTFGSGLALGAYYTLGEGSQLLAQVDGSLDLEAAPGDPTFDFGGLALGFNVELLEEIEIVSQIHLDIPQTADEPFAACAMIGFIATLPSFGSGRFLVTPEVER